ncbi:PIG-L deacetylase family protein [Roseococcus sp. YIM B11640]|uniref:PIG-L deacetylase family protein n=1 Tax=Roseococcus sp. YIM B11640 TaxID=3133973 RepID=UPI003C7B7108
MSDIVVITAHVGDFVWRAGGAIALHATAGKRVTVVCLSCGENGESNIAWKDPAADDASVRRLRREEAEAAAKVLGVAELHLLDLGDYLLPKDPEIPYRLAEILRREKPSLVLTHPERDPSNLDHDRTFEMVLEARMISQAPGRGRDFITPFQVLSFEPHQPELCRFTPNILLDITEVWAKKQEAMRCMPSQSNLWDYYERVARQRGAQAGRRSVRPITHGEAYQSVFPLVMPTLIV